MTKFDKGDNIMTHEDVARRLQDLAEHVREYGAELSVAHRDDAKEKWELAKHTLVTLEYLLKTIQL